MEKLYRIKPLVFDEIPHKVLRTWYARKNAVGTYEIVRGIVELRCNFSQGGDWEMMPAEDLDDAMRKCQQHYEQRLLASLEEVGITELHNIDNQQKETNDR